jgi:CBS domain-containing protein
MAAIDIPEVLKFIDSTPPFSSLTQIQQKQLLTGVALTYARQGEKLTLQGEQATLHLIRRGACEIRSAQGGLVDKLSDGDCFGVSTVLEQNPDGLQVVVLEDSLIYRFQKQGFQALLQEDEDFALFFAHTRSSRLRKLSRAHATDLATPALQLSTPLSQIMARTLISASTQDTVQQAAAVMTEARVSSILVLEQNKLAGIVTDRDLRSRVLAVGASAELPLHEIMTCNPATIDEHSLVMHAQTLMSEKNIHHLPVVSKEDIPVGMITAADLLRHQELSPLLLINQINRQLDVASLKKVCAQLNTLIVNLILTDMKTTDIGSVIAAISDSLTRRLLELGMSELGPAPLPFQFLVFGSQARKDQSLGSDQDNGMMLSRTPNEQEAQYFAELATFVCEGLAQCGIRTCPGDIMASNPKWRMTQEGWQQAFANWVEASSPSALLNASIFFDIRCVYGDVSPVQEVIESMQARVAKSSLFLATLTRAATVSKPPLGFFRNFLLESSGEHKHQLDLKHQGLALINDLARIYGLGCQRYRISTKERLEQAAREKLMGLDIARNLMDAWDELNELRLQAQRQHWQNSGEPSAYLDPSELSSLERKHLKSTFAIIADGQSAALQRFARGYA